jgi:hypothetical protein
VIRRISEALRNQEPITEVLLKHCRDGTAFRNQVPLSPVVDGGGTWSTSSVCRATSPSG